MCSYERHANRDSSYMSENKTEQKITLPKKYVSPTLTKLSAGSRTEGRDFIKLNENSSGLVSGAVS